MKLKRVHRYLGLGLVAVMLVISVTGVMLLWKREYLWLTIPQARETVQLSAESIANSLVKMQNHYAPYELRMVQLGSENLSLHRAFLSDKRYAWHAQGGEQLALWSGSDRFEDWLLDLHHRFLLGNTIGLNIAGFGGLLLVPLMLMGLVLWWPRRRMRKLGIFPQSHARGAWMLSHGNLGAMAILPIFLISITGVILVYPSEARWVMLDGFGAPAEVAKKHIQLDAQPTLRAALEIASTQFVNSRPRWISLPSQERRSFAIGIQQATAWNRMGTTSLTFSEEGLLTINDAQTHRRWRRVFDFSYPLHAAKLSWPLRLLLSLIGLGLCLLCCYGLGSFLKRKQG